MAERIWVISPSLEPGRSLKRYSAVISWRTASPRYSSLSLSRGETCGLSLAENRDSLRRSQPAPRGPHPQLLRQREPARLAPGPREARVAWRARPPAAHGRVPLTAPTGT